MTKVKRFRLAVLSALPWPLVPLLAVLCWVFALNGCKTLATEVRLKVCVVDPGVPLPLECLTPHGEVSTETRDISPNDVR